MLDLTHNFFIYAQALDNEGDPEYWYVRENGATCEKLTLTDGRLPSVRACLDNLVATGHHWTFGGGSLDCRVRWSGVCVITIRPSTLDINGRISPVLVLFNVLGLGREKAARTLLAIPDVLGRELDEFIVQDIDVFRRMLKLPRFLLFIRIVFLGFGFKK